MVPGPIKVTTKIKLKFSVIRNLSDLALTFKLYEKSAITLDEVLSKIDLTTLTSTYLDNDTHQTNSGLGWIVFLCPTRKKVNKFLKAVLQKWGGQIPLVNLCEKVKADNKELFSILFWIALRRSDFPTEFKALWEKRHKQIPLDVLLELNDKSGASLLRIFTADASKDITFLKDICQQWGENLKIEDFFMPKGKDFDLLLHFTNILYLLKKASLANVKELWQLSKNKLKKDVDSKNQCLCLGMALLIMKLGEPTPFMDLFSLWRDGIKDGDWFVTVEHLYEEKCLFTLLIEACLANPEYAKELNQFCDELFNKIPIIHSSQRGAFQVSMINFTNMDRFSFDDQEFFIKKLGSAYQLESAAVDRLLEGKLSELSLRKAVRTNRDNPRLISHIKEKSVGAGEQVAEFIKEFAQAYSWLQVGVTHNNVCVKTKNNQQVTLNDFYIFVNQLENAINGFTPMEERKSVQYEPKPVSSSSDPLPVEQSAPPQVRFKAPVAKFVKASMSASSNGNSTPKSSHSKTKPQKSTKGKNKNPPRQQDFKETEQEPPSREMPEQARYRGPVLLAEKELDFKIQEEQQSEINSQPQVENEIHVDLDGIRKLVAFRNDKLAVLAERLKSDPNHACLVVDLALFDLVSKVNRGLIEDYKLIYPFDCLLIHATHQTMGLNQSKSNQEHSNWIQFVKACYVKEGFKLFEKIVNMEKQGLCKQSREAMSQASTPEATDDRLTVIKTIIMLLPQLQKLSQEEAYKDIADHALSAAFIILGEQYARLCEFSPGFVWHMKANEKAANVFNRYRAYRNLRHPDELEIKSGNISFVKNSSWEEEFPRLQSLLSNDIDELALFWENYENEQVLMVQSPVITFYEQNKTIDSTAEKNELSVEEDTESLGVNLSRLSIT